MNGISENKSYFLALIALAIIWGTYQFVITPTQRAALNQSLSTVSRADPKSVIATLVTLPTASIKVPTAPARATKVPATWPIRATVPVGGTLKLCSQTADQTKCTPDPTAIMPTITPPECYIATAADGHQFCSNGRSLDVEDERGDAGYCVGIKDHDANGNSYGGPICGNGMPAGVLIGAVMTPDEIEAQPHMQQAEPSADWSYSPGPNNNTCITATNNLGVQQTNCTDPGTVYNEANAAVIAQMIKDGKLNGSSGTPKG
jgi:hypothetical protein